MEPISLVDAQLNSLTFFKKTADLTTKVFNLVSSKKLCVYHVRKLTD